jgi:hypothetical protein
MAMAAWSWAVAMQSGLQCQQPSGAGSTRPNEALAPSYSGAYSDMAAPQPARAPPLVSPGISRHLWLGNCMTADAGVMLHIFGPYGPIESVRVFSGRTYAFVNFIHEMHAADAKSALEMQVGMCGLLRACSFNTPERACRG